MAMKIKDFELNRKFLTVFAVIFTIVYAILKNIIIYSNIQHSSELIFLFSLLDLALSFFLIILLVEYELLFESL